jgi:hypothetical protein
MKIRPLVAALLVAGAAGAQASVFSDDFNANAVALNVAPAGWSVANGTVDLIGNGFYDFLPGNGVYVDLDGSTGDAGELSTVINLTGGVSYTLSFDLAGNQRGSSDTVDISFANLAVQITTNSADPFATFAFTFTPTASAAYTLTFADQGRDNIGALLDNVDVSAVPELPLPVMFGAGLLLLGAFKRRRDA